MAAKLITMFYDIETTGVDERKNGIHQISGCIEVNGKVVENFNFKVAPNPKAVIEEEALAVGNVTEEQIKAYMPMREGYLLFIKMLSKYVERYDKHDKMWLCGFNNRSFDDRFLRAWFKQNGDEFFGSWFWSDSLDVMVLSSQYLRARRAKMVDFKLKTVAMEVGLWVDKRKLHDAAYDIMLTREIYLIVTGINLEI